MNRKFGAGLALLAVLLLAGWAASYSHVSQIGSFYTSTQRWDSATGASAGGQVRPYYAGDTLHVGDIAYFSGNNTVAASSTPAAYNRIAGVVVGGTRLGANNLVSTDAIDVGTLAAIGTTSSTPQFVWVLRSGRAWMKNDAIGALVAGDEVIPSASSTGQIRGRAAAIDTFYRVIGRAVVGVAASSTAAVEVSIK